MKYEYPQELPVSAAHDDIAAAVASSQVVIVSGQTGSGKTTQIPKILLEMGRGTHGHQIVHTQPRRIAARTVAERIASEMGVRLGDEIGYQVRFTDASSPKTRLRVVTDGILLAQIQRDPRLSQYDTIIIDEAHERSLNIDFLLGYLTSLLPQRRDLKLVITSATIDSVKFQHHFEQALHRPVPVIEVSGRTYPVQIVYEPLGSEPALMRYVPGFESSAARNTDGDMPRSGRAADADMATAVARACAELVIRASHERGPRDILVFASGEHDIREFETALRRHFGPRADDMRRGDAIEIMPLFARLSSKEQHKVFESHAHQRIVIATNVAETSLTVPGIRYVVDPGTARISRYSKSAKVQRLPIEPISQASADQRSGRCGRVADGIAIRLYDSDDYETRPRFTEPEILRTSLGAVVLHMLSVGVAKNAHDVTHFGFIDPPDVKAVSDGFNELTELQAVARKHGEMALTRTGRQLARIPIDIRLGRMVVEAAHTTTPNTLAAVLVVVAFLSLQDPRERPDEAREEADRIHNRYADASSDFLTALNLWDRVFQADGSPSNGVLRRLCKTEYLSFLRLKQWRDLVSQLGDMCHELKFKVGEPQPASRPSLDIRQLPLNQQAAHSMCCSWDAQGIHTDMLAGLLSMMGMQVVREPKASDFAGLKGAAKARAMKRAAKQSHNDYQGARGTRFALFPASAVAKTTPPWVMSTELVETSRLWARYSAAIDPAWAEPLAGSLTRTTYAEPHWSASRGSAVAKAKVLLYGLPIVQDRTVQWGRINPLEARDFLIRQGLVEGDIQQQFSYDDFVTRNLDVLHDAAEDTSRTRQAAASVSDEDLYDFYNTVLPADVTSLADLAKWWKVEHGEHPQLLDFDPEAVERLQNEDSVSLDDYPDHWHALGTDGTALDLKLSYIYDPHDPADGVSAHIPITVLSRLRPEQFTWNVPGLLSELIVAMIKSLPKALRVQFVPAPDTAQAIRAYIAEHYPDLPGSGESGRPNLPPENEQTGVAGWPDFTHVFTQAAIHVVGAQIHPQVFEGDQWSKLPPYLRMNFIIEKPNPAKSRGRHGSRSGHASHNAATVLGTGRSLVELQRHFAAQAEASARQVVRGKAQSAGAQGKLVEQANLLHKAGATTQSRATMLWQGALDKLRLPSERISSRWLGTEALMLASAPYASTKALSEDLQLAAVKRLLPDIDQLDDDAALAQAVADVEQVYEDTVYAVARDVIAILKRYAEVDKAVSGPADLPMLSVLQSVREHIASLVCKGFIGAAPPDALASIERYLHSDIVRLNKAKTDKNRDVRWAWEADEARQLVERFHVKAKAEPAGPRHESLVRRYTVARWMLEEFYVSLWAQELGTAKPVSLQRIRKALEA
ncbi:MAG: ATP-dependent RNA helicase HrpA [Bifidobacterium tibiigranuli]|jgi:ATP-dependent helicase HrpA|nr:ATP-dependent RNA helicase HrpA [Bifidobacterium tibiigranuli]